MGAIALLALMGFIAIVVLFVAKWFMRSAAESRVRSRTADSVTIRDLEDLKKAGKLTPDEMKRVREAMARRFIETQKEQAEKATNAGLTAEQVLEREAALADIELEKQRLSKPQPPDAPPPTAGRPAPSPSAEPRLPEKLAALAEHSGFEWEELRNAGFLSDEELALLRNHRAGNVE